jgi:uncharacterized protein YfeS
VYACKNDFHAPAGSAAGEEIVSELSDHKNLPDLYFWILT